MGSNCRANPYEATYDPKNDPELNRLNKPSAKQNNWDYSNHQYNEEANQYIMPYQDQEMSRQLKMKVTPTKVQVQVKENTSMFIESSQGDYGLQRVQNTVKISQTQFYNGQVYEKYKVTFKSRFS